jgi:hypothetical protein
MKKIFTLIAMALTAMSMNAQTIIAWDESATSANSVTLNGYTLAITGNTSKTLGKGSTITVDGTPYPTIKLSNGAQNTITAPDGTTFNKVTFYSYINIKSDATSVRDSYWQEINGEKFADASTQGGIMKSCNTLDFNTPGIPGSENLVGLDQPDKREFLLSAPVSKMTFTNKGEQLGFIMIVETVTATGINNVVTALTDGNAPVYNLAGQRVDKNYKGVVISGGKKLIQK